MNLAFDEFVLAASTGDLADETAARPHADAIEFRMDGADNPIRQLEDYNGELPIIATNRPTWEGGNTSSSEDKRLDRLFEATDHPWVAAVDIELVTLEDPPIDGLNDRVRAFDGTVIASVHDFDGTPSVEWMTDRLTTGNQFGDVAKLAITAHEPADVLDLLSATHVVSETGGTVATMAMGAAGRHSRAVAPIYGSRIGYAPVDPGRATAPGQYDLQSLAALIPKLL